MTQDPRMKAHELRQQAQRLYHDVQELRVEKSRLKHDTDRAIRDLTHDAHQRERMSLFGSGGKQAIVLLQRVRQDHSLIRDKQAFLRQQTARYEQMIRQKEQEASRLSHEAQHLETMSPGAFL